MANTSLLGSYSGQDNSALMFRNKVINGDMRIDQRNASITNSGYSVDRWNYAASQVSKFTVAKNSTAPTGYTASLLATSSSAYSIVAGDYFALLQRIEGFNIADLSWGTANAQAITISFWVRSSLTGTFGGALKNSAGNRSYAFTHTISSANTFEYKTITIPGDTSGTWLTDNGVGVQLSFGLGVGSTYSGTAGSWQAAEFLSATGATSVVGTNGATFYITGVQLEAGPVATPFERRPIGTELALCQRYYERLGGGGGDLYKLICISTDSSATSSAFVIPYRVEKRIPNITFSFSGSFAYLVGSGTFSSFAVQADGRTTSQFSGNVVGTGFTTGAARFTRTNSDANAFLAFEAEL